MNLRENAESATFELPGFTRQDVNIEVHGKRLTIFGESKRSERYDKGSYAVQERSYGNFSQIPQGIKTEAVHAMKENGVLIASFTKAGLDQQPQHVTITSTSKT
ncbi:HSP20-like chaperone [Suillus lakei]|nr:HSP20-like chaperone [Suillus lakei]